MNGMVSKEGEGMNEGQYLFMHQDDAVCTVSIDLVSGAILRVSRPKNPELFPLGGPVDTDLCWRDVNLFTNDFRDAAADEEIGEAVPASSELPIYSPGSSTQGDLLKKWTIVDGRRFLVKGNRGATSQNSLNEIVATLLHRRQGSQPHCAYSTFRPANRDWICCVCDCFTTPTTEFILAIDLIESKKKNNSISNHEHLMAVCAANGLSELRALIRSFSGIEKIDMLAR